MIKPLQINLFSMSELRVRMSFPNLRELSKVTKANLNTFKVKVYTVPNLLSKWEEVIEELSQKGMDISISPLMTDNYMDRTRDALNTESPYSCRLDDDIFMSSYVWDFLLSNVHKLDDPEVMSITPILTAGTPTVEYFLLDFLDDEKLREVHSIFKQDNILRACWGVDYSHLHDAVSRMAEWDPNAFYTELSRHNTPFKGVHPIRFSDNANIAIAQYVVSDFDKFMSKQEYSLEPMRGVHNTHPFTFRTSAWRESLEHMYDNFDELSLNVYSLSRNMSTLLIRNGYAIHTTYGSVPSQKSIEDTYYNCIESFKQK
tara:strand:+ start:656 stop:1600 length:945 start_codon:yes stop_codon:yes gene_type:complete